MKNLKSTKALALLLAATLITSCFVGGTFARYITSTSSEDSARVAVWGINADEVTMDLFDAEYELDGTVVAKSNDGDNIIAPGTGKMSKFSIVNLDDTLAPEVMYEVKIDVDDTEIDQRILDNPSIQWKLDNNAWGTWESTKADILALSGDASGVKTYAPLEIATEFANGVEHTIAWQWMLDDNNVQDTAMGNEAVDRDITAEISVRVTARQVQEDTTGTSGLIFNLQDPKRLTFKSDAPLSELLSVTVEDNELVLDTDYKATSGSTIVTLELEYLITLDPGNYTISIISENSTKNSSFTVIDKKIGTPNKTAIVHNDVIPEGGIYYSNITNDANPDYLIYEFDENYITYENKYTAGENFPELKTGDSYIYDGIEYRYNMEFNSSSVYEDSVGWIENSELNGWGAKTTSMYRSYYYNILTTINGANLISLQETFATPSIREVAYIPTTVKSLQSTFSSSFHLTTPPEIPNGVIDMRNTFQHCLALTTAPVIPESVTMIWHTFKGAPITGIVEINSTHLEDTRWIFGLANPENPIILTGTSPYLEDIAASYTENVTVQR